MTLPDLAIKRPVATLMLLLSLSVLGVVAIPRLPLDFFPIVEPPQINVVVTFPGSHPLEGLREVVIPLEEELATIPGVKRLNGSARSGSAQVSVRFSWSTNLDLKKMEVREAVDRVRPHFPEGVGQVRIQTFLDGPADGALLQGRISAPRDLSESWELLERRILRPLERIKGVAQVRLDGVQPQQVRIEIDPDSLKRHGIDPGDLLVRLQASNLDMDLGAITGEVLRYEVRSVGRFKDLEQIRDLRLDDANLRIRDVAQVSLTEPPLDYGRHLDGEFALGIDIFKEPTANTVKTVDRIMARIDEIRNDRELQGINLLVWTNQAEEIRQSLRGLLNAGLFGGLLAVIVLFLFLRRVSTTLIVAVAIPFSLVVTCGIMYLIGSGFNVLTMLGLMVGVGMLVDNAVVVIENIHRREGQGLEPRQAARVGAREVGLAVLAATATTVIVWSWLFTIEPGPMVIYMGAVALTLCLAVVSSLLISLTFIPLAAARFVPHRPVRPGFLLRRAVPAYRGLLGWTLRHRLLALAGLVALAGSAAIPIILIEKTGEVSKQQRDVPIVYRVHDPASLEVMEAHVNRVEDWLRGKQEELGYESVYSFYTENSYAMTRIFMPWKNANDSSLRKLREKLVGDLPVIAGVTLNVGDHERFRHGGGGGDRRLVNVALHGEDVEYLHDLALDVENRLRGVDGVKEVFGPTVHGQHEARILINSDRARSLGLSPRQIANAVSFTYRGRQLRHFHRAGNEVEMRIGLPRNLRPGLAALDDFAIPRPDATPVPLGSVADVVIERTDQVIEREDRKTTQWVVVEFDRSVTTEVGMERISEQMAGVIRPEGYSWDWGQRGRDRDDALGIMMRGVALSLVLVVLLMAALFESVLQPAAILITLPLAFFGAFWALWLRGHALGPVAFFGVIILIGMVVNNGIVMVDHVNSLRRAGKERVEALIEGCGDRLRPVLMTAITTIFGLAPLAFSRFAVGNVLVDSMAIVIIGGLASSTIFTLVALPVWYTMVEDAVAVFLRALPVRAGHRRRKPAGVLVPRVDSAVVPARDPS